MRTKTQMTVSAAIMIKRLRAPLPPPALSTTPAERSAS
jgi:hypothetical protein